MRRLVFEARIAEVQITDDCKCVIKYCSRPASVYKLTSIVKLVFYFHDKVKKFHVRFCLGAVH